MKNCWLGRRSFPFELVPLSGDIRSFSGGGGGGIAYVDNKPRLHMFFRYFTHAGLQVATSNLQTLRRFLVGGFKWIKKDRKQIWSSCSSSGYSTVEEGPCLKPPSMNLSKNLKNLFCNVWLDWHASVIKQSVSGGNLWPQEWSYRSPSSDDIFPWKRTNVNCLHKNLWFWRILDIQITPYFVMPRTHTLLC